MLHSTHEEPLDLPPYFLERSTDFSNRITAEFCATLDPCLDACNILDAERPVWTMDQRYHSRQTTSLAVLGVFERWRFMVCLHGGNYRVLALV